jgi:DNA-binding transcriptional ArsR family regulator
VSTSGTTDPARLPGGRVDQLDLRRTNLGLLLRALRDHGPRSRASLAAATGLTRSTVSSLVAELVERGLVREGEVQRSTVGRPGTAVGLDGSQVCGVGAALDARTLSVEEVLDHLAALVTSSIAELAAADRRPVGLTVGVAGLVDRGRGPAHPRPQPGVA